MAQQLVQVMESFSGTLLEDQMVDKPLFRKDGTPQLNEDGTQKTKAVKEEVRVPITLNKGQVFEARHLYVKTWPQFFGPVIARPEMATANPGELRGE
jgi:hypothetical protein